MVYLFLEHHQKVLPINSVGDIVIKSQGRIIQLKKIMNKFNEIIADDIIKFKIF